MREIEQIIKLTQNLTLELKHIGLLKKRGWGEKEIQMIEDIASMAVPTGKVTTQETVSFFLAAKPFKFEK